MILGGREVEIPKILKIPIVIYIGNLEQNPGISWDFQLPEGISPSSDNIFEQNKVLDISIRSLLVEKHNFERLGPLRSKRQYFLG